MVGEELGAEVEAEAEAADKGEESLPPSSRAAQELPRPHCAGPSQSLCATRSSLLGLGRGRRLPVPHGMGKGSGEACTTPPGQSRPQPAEASPGASSTVPEVGSLGQEVAPGDVWARAPARYSGWQESLRRGASRVAGEDVF